ncbi:START domain-containing protein [Tellurirhabdus bombi]|uniref:START domain-containing protein n=1 Tax=Tellurirhabdus bombi TaxID=2907205 RepID=UPI001F1E3B9C|nr:START domain-containing protein [Tellurirhabdus bombi]
MVLTNSATEAIKHYVFSLLIIYGFTLETAQAQQTSNWRLEKDKHGIQVYSRNLSDTKLKELKVVFELSGQLSDLLAVLSDADHLPDWVYGTRKSYVIRRVSPSEFYYHTEMNLPWPASNRDVSIRFHAQQDPQTKVLTIRSESVGNQVPLQDGIVRVPYSLAHWTVKPLSNEQMHVEYIFRVDPGGKLPAWLVNLVASTGPMQTFQKLRELIKNPKYQNKKYPFLES